MKNITYSSLNSQQKHALDEAANVLKTSYSPYSHFPVGAALYTNSGEVFTGSNVENASGTSICAERSAVVKANSMGIRKFKRIAIIGKGENVTAPCGMCRQILYENVSLAEKDLEVVMSNNKKAKIVISTIKELLPMGFGPRDIKVDISKY